MEHFTIVEWKKCISLLDNYDTCGALQIPEKYGFRLHYTGNFWWANSKYIANLKLDPTCMWYKEDSVKNRSIELSLCTGSPIDRHFNMFDAEADIIDQVMFDKNLVVFTPESYIGKTKFEKE
jgi:hypothetical protein